MSTPPSPYFVKNPTPKSSTLLPVPTTKAPLVWAIWYSVVIRNLALELAKASSCLLLNKDSKVSYRLVRSTVILETLEYVFSNHFIWLLALFNSVCCWCIGIDTSIVGIPLSAHSVDTKAESTPPDIPITNLPMPLVTEYCLSHSIISFIIFKFNPYFI